MPEYPPDGYAAIVFTDPDDVLPGFTLLGDLVDGGTVRLADIEFVHSIDGVASTVLGGRVDKHLSRFDHGGTGLLDRDELDAMAATVPHGSTAAILLYAGDLERVLAAWRAAGAVVRTSPPSSP